jgi:transcriptional regulator GlxA family with amidase domain
MRIDTERGNDLALDTLLVGAPPDVAKPPPELVDYLHRASASTRRIASICVGAFILGEAGLLDGRRSTTHWLFGRELQQRYPGTRVEVDRIYIADGQIWTSAGMTAGIDLALGLVERDLGPGKALEIACMMVLHHRRAGGQSQHSALLDLDLEVRSDRVQSALQYARRNLSGNLSVERLAAVACLSPRQFSRLFRFETLSFRRTVGRLGGKAGFTFQVHPHMLCHACGYKLANDGVDTRSLQHYLGHKNIQHTVRYTELAPDRFKGFWKD